MENRKFKKLRISLTNLCNLACSYCVPQHYSNGKNIPDIISLATEPLSSQAKQRRMNTKDLSQIVKALHLKLDLSEIRLTGGEPLLHPGLSELIQNITQIGIDKIGLTTNGFLLPLQADKLKKSGLKSVNISLDAIDSEIFYKVTRKNYLKRVLNGIDKALDAGLDVKLNSVIMRGINSNQVLPLIKYAESKKITIRFIELMKMGHLYQSNTDLFYSANEILNKMATNYTISALNRTPSSTAKYWELNSGQKIGIIANEGFPFCADCDRLRLDEYGRIYGCISSNKGFSLAEHLDNPSELQKYLELALATKQKYKFKGSPRSMINVGG